MSCCKEGLWGRWVGGWVGGDVPRRRGGSGTGSLQEEEETR